MRKAILYIGIFVFTGFIYSCAESDMSEEISIEEQATEGEDGSVDEESDEESEGN